VTAAVDERVAASPGWWPLAGLDQGVLLSLRGEPLEATIDGLRNESGQSTSA
jgi:hypothetical protein